LQGKEGLELFRNDFGIFLSADGAVSGFESCLTASGMPATLRKGIVNQERAVGELMFCSDMDAYVSVSPGNLGA
jgi:hypothetical protein